MINSLQHRLAAVSDVRPVPDPWGFGVTFSIVREGAQRLEKWRRDRLAANPLAQQIAETAAQLQFTRASKGGSLTPEADDAIIASGAAKIRISGEQLAAMSDEVIEDAVQRLDGWSGLIDVDSGNPIPFSAAQARELLTSTAWVEETQEYGGQPLGRALLQFVVAESRRSEAYRTAVVEAAAGN